MIETHCHLDKAEFDADRAAVLERARAAGVTDLVVPAVGPPWDDLLVLARATPGVPAGLGVHPQLLPELDPRDDDRLLADLGSALSRGGAVAVGECGLDGPAILFVASTAPIPTLADVDLSLWQPPLKHVTSLASIGRPVFVPATWAHPGQQPLTVTERFRPMYDFQAQNPIRVENPKILGFLVGRIRRLAAKIAEQPPALLYLLVLYPRLLGPDPPAHAEIKASDPLFTLLAIDPPASP